MEKLRELLRRLLGVSAISPDLSDVVSRLFQVVLELEAKCPQLVCHLHVSGVSQVTGDSFFVVLHDASLQASRSARRVINSVYTHLHGEAAMALSSAIWLQAQRRKSAAAARPASAGADPSQVNGAPAAEPLQAPQTPDGAAASSIDDGPTGVDASSSLGGTAVQSDALAPAGSSLSAADGERLGEGNKGSDKEVTNTADPRIPFSRDPPPMDPLMVLTSGFRRPDVHVPSDLARQQVEALFTVRKSGWTRVLRETLASMRSVLCGHYHLAGRPRLQGMLKWWPVDLEAAAEFEGGGADGERVGGRRARVAQCTPFPYPVRVQGRHLPIRERIRNKDDMVEETVEVSSIVPARSELLYGVVATILLLLDKEPHVRAVVTKKLADNGVVHGNDDQGSESDGREQQEALDELLAGVDSPALSSGPESSQSSPSANGAGDDGGRQSVAVAARLAARQAAAAASVKASASVEANKKLGVAARTPLKRRGAGGQSTRTKRARVDASLDDELSFDLCLPPLDMAADVVSCNVLLEADLVADMTYLMLATNWCVPATGDHSTDGEAVVAPRESWSSIVDNQATIDFVLGERTVLDCRRSVTAKADEIRAGDVTVADEEPPIYVNVMTPSSPNSVPVSMSTLGCMSVLHEAAKRLEALRGGVAWLAEVAKSSNARVPVIVGDDRESTGTIGTSLMQVLLSKKPADLVWRVGGRGVGGVDEDVVVPAHRVMNDMAAVPMVDDLITVNSIILQRACNSLGNNVYIIHCSVFRRLLSAADEDAVARVAEDVDRLAEGATTLAGVCNIGDVHWVAFLLDLTSKTVTRYDSGSHFESLREKVNTAHQRVREFAKILGDLAEPSEDEGASAGELDADKKMPAKVKVWSLRRLSSPSQDDTCSCGPFAFGFVWGAALGKKSKLQTADGSAMRLEMLAAVVADGLDSESAVERNARASTSTDAV